MRLLLDTHIWLWSRGESTPDRLTRRVARAIEDSRNELWISPVSTWEVLSLCGKGRLKLQGGPVAWISKVLAGDSYREAPLSHDVVLGTETFALPHHDPMDMFLVASAKVYGLTLVTADAKLLAAKACRVLANR
jgi:PIN domain nuclease of toxin-antitoxin system